jgi:glutamine synthetase
MAPPTAQEAPPVFSSADEVLAFIKDEDVKFVDIRFCDLPGIMQHFNVPAETVDDRLLHGRPDAFDGSSIRGFQAIHESDMKLVPDVATAYIDPFRVEKTLIMNFSIVDPFTGEPYSRDPRNIAAKAEAYLKSTGIADTAFFGAEAEFYVFDDVRFKTKANELLLPRLQVEAAWNTGRVEEGGNLRLQDRATRVATSPSRRSTTSPTPATRSASSWRRSASRSSAATTRSAPPASRRSTTASTRCCSPATT